MFKSKLEAKKWAIEQAAYVHVQKGTDFEAIHGYIMAAIKPEYDQLPDLYNEDEKNAETLKKVIEEIAERTFDAVQERPRATYNRILTPEEIREKYSDAGEHNPEHGFGLGVVDRFYFDCTDSDTKQE